MHIIIDNIFVKVNIMLADGQYNDAANELMAWQAAPLARYYRENAPHQKTLKKPEFNELWHAKLDSLHLKESPDFKFVSQPGILDADIFLGYVFYLLAIKSKQGQKPYDYRQYLKQAMIHHSIAAHQTCLHEIIIAENPNHQDAGEALARLLEDWVLVANLQGTPGYLLLASGYVHLAELALANGHSEEHRNAYYAAWKYLHMAALSEQYCDAAINNAYFGEGMRMANLFEFESIGEMKLGCASIAKKTLGESEQFSAESEAKREFASLTHTFKAPCWSLSLATEITGQNELDAEEVRQGPQLL